jgi:branched-chain amino acid transport system substrate-binding protein
VDKYISGSFVRIALAGAVAGGLLYWMLSSDDYYQSTADQRSARSWPVEKLKIAVPWPQDGRMSLIQGVKLGLKELNSQQEEDGKPVSPLKGKVELQFFDEAKTDSIVDVVARQIAKDKDIVAVIGHEASLTAVASAVTYEKNGILYISPKASLSRLTRHRFRSTFRLVPDDEAFAAALVQFAISQGWKRVGVLYARFEQGEALARAFALHARDAELELPYFRSYLPLAEENYEKHDFRELLGSISRQPTDAILLADRLPWAGKVLLDMQKMRINQPILVGDKLDSSSAWKIAGKGTENLYIASAVDPASTETAFVDFRHKFLEHWKKEPGYGSAQGFEAFNLLIDAIEYSESASPLVLTTTLRTRSWKGLFGEYSFSDAGGLIGRTIIMKRIDNGVIKSISMEDAHP